MIRETRQMTLKNYTIYFSNFRVFGDTIHNGY